MVAGGPFRPSTISCKTRKIARIREEKGRRWAGCLRLRDRVCLWVEGGGGPIQPLPAKRAESQTQTQTPAPPLGFEHGLKSQYCDETLQPRYKPIAWM